MAFNFNGLPTEIRSAVWNKLATNYGQGRFIECKWEGTPYYQKATQRRNTLRRSEKAGIRFRYRLYGFHRPLATLSVCRESRAETLKSNPNYLQLNRGPKIYFNAQTDTIYFDLMDMFHMYKYCENMMERVGRLNNVHGFDEILHLAKSRTFNFRCIMHLILDNDLGPLMPNVEDIVYRIRPGRIINMWILDIHLGYSFNRLLPGLKAAQAAKVVNFMWSAALHCGILFQPFNG